MRCCIRAAAVWLSFAVVLWLAYAPWRRGAVERDVIQSDASEYHAAAVSLVSKGVFSTSLAWPDEPDNYRPPLFPLMAAALYKLGGIRPLGMLLMNVMIFAVCVLLLPKILQALGTCESGALRWTCILAAVCPVWIVTSLMYMPDALFTLLMAGFCLLWLNAMRAMTLLRVVAAAIVLGLATLTKPVSLYLPIALLLWFAWIGLAQRRYVRSGVYALVFCAVYVAVLMPWYIRNYRVYQRVSFVSYEGPSLLDYTAANVVRRAYKCDLMTARAVLHRHLQARYDMSQLEEKARALLPQVHETNVAWHAKAVRERFWPVGAEREVLRSMADLSAAEKKLFVAVFKSNWRSYALDSVRGMLNIIFMPPWQECLRMTMPEIDAMALALACVRGDWAALAGIGWGRVAVAVALAGWMTGLAVLIAMAACTGLVLLVRRGEYGAALTCVIIIGYFLAIAGPNGEARYRAPLLPLVFPLAGIACARFEEMRAHVVNQAYLDPATREGRRRQRPDLMRAGHEGNAAVAPPIIGIEIIMKKRWPRRPGACGAHGQRGRCPSTPRVLGAGPGRRTRLTNGAGFGILVREGDTHGLV